MYGVVPSTPSGFGLEPLGAGYGPFGGDGLISVLGVLPESLNSAIVVFDVAPRTDNTRTIASATNVSRWSLEAVDPRYTTGDGQLLNFSGLMVPTYSPKVVHIEPASSDYKQIRIYTDIKLETRVRYDVTVPDSIKSTDCGTFVGPTTFSWVSRTPGRALANNSQLLRYTDIDYNIIPRGDDETSVYLFDDAGDLALQNPDDSLKKRVLRRLLTSPGGFSFLPGYGSAIRVKALAKAGNLQAMTNAMAEQVRSEPDVLGASVSVRTARASGSLFVYVDVRVVKSNQEERRYLYEFPSA